MLLKSTLQLFSDKGPSRRRVQRLITQLYISGHETKRPRTSLVSHWPHLNYIQALSSCTYSIALKQDPHETLSSQTSHISTCRLTLLRNTYIQFLLVFTCHVQLQWVEVARVSGPSYIYEPKWCNNYPIIVPTCMFVHTHRPRKFPHATFSPTPLHVLYFGTEP